MVVEIISVGTEILMGNIVNTNAQYIASRLAHLGLDSYYQTVVGDNPERLKGVLDVAFSRSDAVIMSGGLGPTRDDLTKEMLMEYFGKETYVDEKVIEAMEERLRKRGEIQELSESMRKQAVVPRDSLILYNHHGTAPGCVMEREDGKVCILLPGPPGEMKPMFEECCELYLKARSDKVFVSLNVKLLGRDEASLAMVGESPVADKLGDLLDSKNPTVATYAKEDGCLIRVTAAAPTHEEAMALARPMAEKCRAIIGAQYVRYIEED